MKIMILAGNSTQKICKLISGKEGIDTFPYENISQAMRELNLVTEADQFVVFDTGFFIDGRQLEIVEVFENIAKSAESNKNTEFLLITQDENIRDAYNESIIDNKNTRMEFVDKLSTKVIIDCILGRYKKETKKEEKQEEPEELPITPIKTEEPKPIEQPKPQPKPQPVKEEQKKKIKQEKPKPSRVFKKRQPLSDFFNGTKVILVTGNPNTGCRSSAYYTAVSLANGGVNTLLIDMDVQTKGINFYIDCLDSNKSNVAQKSGLLFALDSIDHYEENICNISSNLDLLGLTSSTSWIAGINALDEQKIRALINYVRVDYDCVVINIPIGILLEKFILIELCDTVIYCTNATINGIMNIDYYLSILAEMNKDVENMMLVLHKKLKYLLCNTTSKTGLNLDNFLEELFNITESETLHRMIVGEVPHQEEFDRYQDTKISLMSDKIFEENFYNIVKNIIS